MNPRLSTVIAQQAVALVTDRVGISVGATELGQVNELGCILRPGDGHPNESFSIALKLGWRSAEVSFVPAKFAGPMLRQLGHSSKEGKQLFASYAEALLAQKTVVTFRVNGADTDPLDPALWPLEWKRVELGFRRFIVQEEVDEQSVPQLILDLVVPAFAMLAGLIGVEELAPVNGELEGRPVQTLVTRYERKLVNRELCIRLKGYQCTTCGFDFTRVYGPLGKDYIEIHHATPVSTMGPDYVLDVRRDLFPLCANCHAMAHREDPPVPIEKLKQIVNRSPAGSLQ
jgi:5-methylcytosine-specific restriction enzyme A